MQTPVNNGFSVSTTEPKINHESWEIDRAAVTRALSFHLKQRRSERSARYKCIGFLPKTRLESTFARYA